MRSLARAALLAGVMAALPLVAAPASAQVLEIGFDQSPVGLDPHLATAFSTFAIVNGTRSSAPSGWRRSTPVTSRPTT